MSGLEHYMQKHIYGPPCISHGPIRGEFATKITGKIGNMHLLLNLPATHGNIAILRKYDYVDKILTLEQPKLFKPCG